MTGRAPLARSDLSRYLFLVRSVPRPDGGDYKIAAAIGPCHFTATGMGVGTGGQEEEEEEEEEEKKKK